MKQPEDKLTREMPGLGRGRRGPYGDRYDKRTSPRTVLRASTALTMAEFAKLAGCSERTVRNWESKCGTTRPAVLVNIKAACIAHGCDGQAFALVFGLTVAEARAKLPDELPTTAHFTRALDRVNRAASERAKAAKAAAPGQAGKRQPVRYRNRMTGETWSGRGMKPRWLQVALANGASIHDFIVGVWP